MQPIEKHVVISAPLSAVWRALTDIAVMRQWMGRPEMGIAIDTDWAVGSGIEISGFLHGHFRAWGTVVCYASERRLCYTQLSSLSRLPDEPASYSTLCFTLATMPSQTALALTIEGFPTEAIYKHLNFYWSTALEVFKRLVEQAHDADTAAGQRELPTLQ